MNSSSANNKPIGKITNNPAFQFAAEREKQALKPTQKTPSDQRAHKTSDADTEHKVLYSAPQKPADTHADASPVKRQEVSRSRSHSRSPDKTRRLQSRKRSTDLPRVQRQIVTRLNLGPLQQQNSDAALAQLSGPSLKIAPHLAALQTQLSPQAQASGSVTARRALPTPPAKNNERTRSESPKKKLPAIGNSGQTPLSRTARLLSDELLDSPEPATPTSPGTPGETRGRSRVPQGSPKKRKPLPKVPLTKPSPAQTTPAQEPFESPKTEQTSASVQSTPRQPRAFSPAGARPMAMLRPKAPSTAAIGLGNTDSKPTAENKDPSKV